MTAYIDEVLLSFDATPLELAGLVRNPAWLAHTCLERLAIRVPTNDLNTQSTAMQAGATAFTVILSGAVRGTLVVRRHLTIEQRYTVHAGEVVTTRPSLSVLPSASNGPSDTPVNLSQLALLSRDVRSRLILDQSEVPSTRRYQPLPDVLPSIASSNSGRHTSPRQLPRSQPMTPPLPPPAPLSPQEQEFGREFRAIDL